MDKGVKTAILALIVLALVTPFASAITTTGHIKLLAVYQEGTNFTGSPADLQLEIKPGSGRVFLETIPLSKVDTQISTRFAKEMACKFAETDCNAYDFFYTIKSPAGIVGGPSAGGAISVLTVAMLKELPVSQDTAMTGTINSGELIGPVGSLKQKIDAAKDAEIKTVLVPAVQSEKLEDNVTNMIEYGKELGVKVVPVETLGEALTYITGTEFAEAAGEIDVPDSYQELMLDVAEELCARAESLIQEADVFDTEGKEEIDFDWVQLQKEAQNLTEKGSRAFEEGNTYSAASYCFGANVKAQTLIYSIMDLTEEQSAEEAEALQRKIDDFDKAVERRKKETITDLQTYMIVKERILEARQALADAGNDSAQFGYIGERLNSGVAWSVFFNQDGEEFNLDEASLQTTCEEMLGEVDERFQYLNLFFPGILNDIRNNLLAAHKHYMEEDYALCIYIASRTKAEANIMVTMLGVDDAFVDEVLNQKIEAARRAVAKQIDKGMFPIIAYSYYEYATSLQQENDYAALLYAEYALELSDLDIYFEKKEGLADIDTGWILDKMKEFLPTIIFIWGIILGLILGWLIMRERRPMTGKTRPSGKKPAKIRHAPLRNKRTNTNLRLR
ncbi:hypothetical protein KY359_02395 [Candidatus Woesearchaeota archaeon]|nr:hypothetical protein [Candidatus Woesearchaeota archaeon]